MPFWIIWCVGLVITIILAVKIYNRDKMNPIALHILVIICIFIVGGIPDGSIIGYVFSFEDSGSDLLFNIVVSLVAMILTYSVGYLVLSFSLFKLKSQVLFFVAFLLSVATWSGFYYSYNINIEEVAETTVIEKQERDLIYFCNVPVQEKPVNINESTSITTSGEISYWYVSENGSGLYDVAAASSSEMIYIDETETPYVEIIKYCTKKKEIDNNVGKEEVIGEEQVWTEYNFYLPKYILNYQLN